MFGKVAAMRERGWEWFSAESLNQTTLLLAELLPKELHCHLRGRNSLLLPKQKTSAKLQILSVPDLFWLAEALQSFRQVFPPSPNGDETQDLLYVEQVFYHWACQYGEVELYSFSLSWGRATRGRTWASSKVVFWSNFFSKPRKQIARVNLQHPSRTKSWL